MFNWLVRSILIRDIKIFCRKINYTATACQLYFFLVLVHSYLSFSQLPRFNLSLAKQNYVLVCTVI